MIRCGTFRHTHTYHSSLDPAIEICSCGEVRAACPHAWQTTVIECVGAVWYTFQKCTRCDERRKLLADPEDMPDDDDDDDAPWLDDNEPYESPTGEPPSEMDLMYPDESDEDDDLPF